MENEHIDYLEQEVKRLGNVVKQKDKQMEQMDSTIEILQSRGSNTLSLHDIDDITTHKQYIELNNKFKEAQVEAHQLKVTNLSINDELIKLRTDAQYTKSQFEKVMIKSE